MASHRFVYSHDELEEAYEAQSEEIPILFPPDPDEASRWTRVLSWYQARRGDGGTRPSRERDSDWIVAVGDRSPAVGPYLSHLLGRRFTRVRTVDEAAHWVVAERPGSVLFLLPYRCVSPPALSHLWSELTINGVLGGLLPTDDPSALSFAIAKLYLADGPSPRDTCALDAIRREIRFGDRVTLLSLQHLSELFGGDWGALTLYTHGEGTHLYAGQAVVCGALAPERLNGSGKLVPGGCIPNRACKREANGMLRPVYLSDLRAVYLNLMSCSSMRGWYPSDVDLADAALRSYPAVVVGPTRKFRLAPSLASLVMALLVRGWSAAAVNQFCNEVYAARREAAGFVLIGDPCWTLRFDDARTLDRPAWGAVEWDPVATCQPAATIPGFVGEVPRGGTLFMGAGRLCVWSETAAPVRVEDHAERLERMGAGLSRLLTRWQDLGRLDRGLTREAGPKAEIVQTVQESLQRLHQKRGELESSVARAEAACRSARFRKLWDRRIPRQVAEVAAAVREWDSAVGAIVRSLLFDNNVRNKPVHDALTNELIPSETRTSTDTCMRCGSKEVHTTFTTYTGLPGRIDVACPICGPRESSSPGGPRIRIRDIVAASPGQTLRIEVSACLGETVFPQPGQFLLEVRGQSTASFFRHEGTDLPRDGVGHFTFQLPEDCPPDECRAQAVWIQELEIAYAHLNFNAVPRVE